MSRERYLSLVHFIVGAGSPTELQGRRTSFIHGVVTVPPKDRILAGTAQRYLNVLKDKYIYLMNFKINSQRLRKRRQLMRWLLLALGHFE